MKVDDFPTLGNPTIPILRVFPGRPQSVCCSTYYFFFGGIYSILLFNNKLNLFKKSIIFLFRMCIDFFISNFIQKTFFRVYKLSNVYIDKLKFNIYTKSYNFCPKLFSVDSISFLNNHSPYNLIYLICLYSNHL